MICSQFSGSYDFMLQIVENIPDLPKCSLRVPAGFPSPAADSLEERINLNTLLIERPSSTFIMQVSGNSMDRAGILDGDHIVVDKSKAATSGKIVVAVINGDMTVKYLEKTLFGFDLKAANPKYPTINLTEGSELEIWGVVVGVVRRCD